MRTLDIDLGNSFCKWRLRDDLLSLDGGRVALDTQGISEIAARAPEVDRVNYCSVGRDRDVETLLAGLALAETAVVKAFITTREMAGLRNSYTDPSQMGSDRWLASIAAALIYPGRELCVVDCGSAVNVEFVSARGVHTGGYIVPGLKLMRDSLLAKTAKVKIDAQRASENVLPGLCTTDNVCSGTLLTLVALVEKLRTQMRAGGGLLVLAGGDAQLVVSHLDAPKDVVTQEQLVLQGFTELARAGVEW